MASTLEGRFEPPSVTPDAPALPEIYEMIRALPPLAFAAAFLAGSAARADPGAPARLLGARIEADLDVGAPMGTGESRLSFGAGGRFGWRFELGPLWIQPEIGGHYTVFTRYGAAGCVACQRALIEHPARAFGGLRIGGQAGAGVLEPALFGHAGYGWVTTGTPGATPPEVYDKSGPAFDAGFAIDVKVVRNFRFGLHCAYNVVTPATPPFYVVYQDAVRWISAGVHLGAAL
jgi:hypothetical protein